MAPSRQVQARGIATAITVAANGGPDCFARCKKPPGALFAIIRCMIGERLREARDMRGMSLMDVAGKAHISAATLSRIENNKQGLDFGLFLVLAKILARAPAELVEMD